jgi:hypothetical protein
VRTPLGARPFGFAARHGYQSDADTGLLVSGGRPFDASTGRGVARGGAGGYNDYATGGPPAGDPPSVVEPGPIEVEPIRRPPQMPRPGPPLPGAGRYIPPFPIVKIKPGEGGIPPMHRNPPSVSYIIGTPKGSDNPGAIIGKWELPPPTSGVKLPTPKPKEFSIGNPDGWFWWRPADKTRGTPALFGIGIPL